MLMTNKDEKNVEKKLYNSYIYDWKPLIISVFTLYYGKKKSSLLSTNNSTINVVDNNDLIFFTSYYFENEILNNHYLNLKHERTINGNWKIYDYFILGSDVPNELLNLCYVKKSKIHGNGVFAKCDIPEGTVITLMPAQIVKEKETKAYWFHPFINKKFLKILKKTDIIVNDYSLECGIVDICGNPYDFENSAYMGHLINDGIGPFKDLPTDEVLRQIQILQIYSVANIDKKNNTQFLVWENFPGAFIKSTKNIKKDEELLVSYGKGYWLDKYIN